MRQTTYGYHLGGQRNVAIFLFLYMSTLFIDMITLVEEWLNNGKHEFTILTIQCHMRIASSPLCYKLSSFVCYY